MARVNKGEPQEVGTVEVPLTRYAADAMFLREVVAEGTVGAGPLAGVRFELGETNAGLTFSFGKIGDDGRIVFIVRFVDLTQSLVEKAIQTLADDKSKES